MRRLKKASKAVSNSVKRIHTYTKNVYAHVSPKVARAARATHTQVAKRPHLFLASRLPWYQRWHENRHHTMVHTGVVAVYAIFVMFAVFVSYQNSSAADLSTTWNFSNTSEYTFDTNEIDTASGSARLKAQNYANDASTAALYHFDESSGTTVSDSSSNGNNGVASGGFTFGAGNLNNAGILTNNGIITVPDSASLTLGGQQTIEAWTKFNTAFNANSNQNQTIIDKGSYRLFYDRTSGRATYERANPNATSWLKQAGNGYQGSSIDNGYNFIDSSIVNGSNTYIGIGGGNDVMQLGLTTGYAVGQAEVWQQTGTILTKLGGGGLGGSWSGIEYRSVTSLAINGSTLYAGLTGISFSATAEVWSCNISTSCTTWTKIGGDGVNSSWAVVDQHGSVASLLFVGGNLYAGVGDNLRAATGTARDTGNGQLWRYNGTSWTKIGGNGVNSSWQSSFAAIGYMSVTSLSTDGTNIFAGLDGEYEYCDEFCSNTARASVWRFNGTSWTKIGGDGLASSWASETQGRVSSLTYFGGNLYAGVGTYGYGVGIYPSTGVSGSGDVWRYNGTTWTKIGGDGLNSGWSGSLSFDVGSLANDGTNLYASESRSNNAIVWRYNGTTWTAIGNPGLSGMTGFANYYSLSYGNGLLYAGMSHNSLSVGSGLWGYNGTSWASYGGNFVYGSWGNTRTGPDNRIVYNNVSTTYQDKLYVGKSSPSIGGAQVWEFSNGVWKIIGGQLTRGSWANDTYAGVYSLETYGGNLYAGLGVNSGQAEVWRYNGSIWTKVAGGGVNSSWNNSSTSVDSMAVYGNSLYAGVTNSAGSEVWRFSGATWTRVGGAGVNSSWTGTISVPSMTVYRGNLYAGLGRSTNQSLLWRYNGISWVHIGGPGSGVSGSWGNGSSEVTSLAVYRDRLVAGLGRGYNQADVWQYDETSWTQIGGDSLNGSWLTDSNVEHSVAAMSVYNGSLYVSTNVNQGSAKVWKFSGTTWSLESGDGTSGSWTENVGLISSLTPYSGKLFALGYTASGGEIWSFGANPVVVSSQTSQDTNWHHIAGTYDGTTMRLFIDGVQSSSLATSTGAPDNTSPLYIGMPIGDNGIAEGTVSFQGSIDEVRLSTTARTSLTTRPYSTTQQTISLANPMYTSGVLSYESFSVAETVNGGSIAYRLSKDNGTTWDYWNGTAWALSSALANASTAAAINTNIATYPATLSGLRWQAVLSSDGNQQVTLNSVTVTANSDVIAPSTNANNIQALRVAGGSALAAGSWTNGASPYFSWNAGTDAQSGILGYCLYLGQDNTANPASSKGILGTSIIPTGGNCQFATNDPFINLATAGLLSSPLTTSNSPYYLVVKAIDRAGNVFPTTTTFNFRFDNTPPLNPAFITAPSTFINTKEATFTWPTSGAQAASDGHSGVVGLQYRIGTSSWYGDLHNGSGDISDLLDNDGSYATIPTPDFNNIVDGTNTVSFRTWDVAGNISTTTVTAALKVNTQNAPSEPQSLSVNPTNSNGNAFSFSWTASATFVGNVNNLNYCYTVNTLPTESTCSYTGTGITSLASGAYATQPGANTMYVAARDESGGINYATFSSVTFTSTTPSPGLPGNVDIADVSVKTTTNWRLAVTWDEPQGTGIGIRNYKVFRSINASTYTQVGTSTSTTYIDTGLTQQRYYYRITACDSTNNCSANSPVVSLTPTGKFIAPANLIGDPSVSNTTTKRAKINWITDRTSDSKVAIGTKSGTYSDTELGNSNQVAVHEVSLDNLAAGTTYYYIVKWTDEDGNLGLSQEQSFTTQPAPVIKEVSSSNVRLSSADIGFTTIGASKVNVYYGETDALGSVQTINTSNVESRYNISLSGLKDGTKYFYQLSTFDIDNTEYRGDISSFTTPPSPKVSNVRFEPLENAATSTQTVSWTTNVPTTSIVTYGKVGTVGDDISESQLSTSHTVSIANLDDNSDYFLVVKGTDKDGNRTSSDQQLFKTALDTRPPSISNVSTETSIRGTGADARGQIIVSWRTDEPSTSQVSYASGSAATVFNNKTAEDTQLTTEHLVVVSGLSTSQVYSIKVASYDKSRNQALGNNKVSIIGRANESVLTIILNSLQKALGI